MPYWPGGSSSDGEFKYQSMISHDAGKIYRYDGLAGRRANVNERMIMPTAYTIRVKIDGGANKTELSEGMLDLRFYLKSGFYSDCHNL